MQVNAKWVKLVKLQEHYSCLMATFFIPFLWYNNKERRIIMTQQKFPFIFMIISTLITLSLGIFYHNDFFTVFASIVGLINVSLLTMGLSCSYIFGISSCLLYPIPSYKSKLYGEVILYLLILLPIRIYGVISWLKHKNKKTKSVAIEDITKKETMILSIVAITMFVLFCLLLKVLDTRQVIFSSLSIVFSFVATYLLARRSKYGFASYLVIDVITTILWAIPLIKGDTNSITMFVAPLMWFVIDTYGFINWKKQQNIQEGKYEIGHQN